MRRERPRSISSPLSSGVRARNKELGPDKPASDTLDDILDPVSEYLMEFEDGPSSASLDGVLRAVQRALDQRASL